MPWEHPLQHAHPQLFAGGLTAKPFWGCGDAWHLAELCRRLEEPGALV